MRVDRPVAAALVVTLLLAAGCRTAALPTPAGIRVPRGLSAQNVEIAILAALAGRRTPGTYDAGTPMDPDEHEELVTSYLLTMSGRAWVVESRESDRIEAVLSRPGRYHLRVEVSYDDERVEVALLDSHGLGQTERHIHKNAVKWIRTLERRIQTNLGDLAHRRRASVGELAQGRRASATAAAISA